MRLKPSPPSNRVHDPAKMGESAWPEYAYTIWTRVGSIHFYYHPDNWPKTPWLDTSTQGLNDERTD